MGIIVFFLDLSPSQEFSCQNAPTDVVSSSSLALSSTHLYHHHHPPDVKIAKSNCTHSNKTACSRDHISSPYISNRFTSDHTPKPRSPIRRFFKSKPSTPRVKPPSKSADNVVERVFQYIDGNGDGKISPSELQSCIRAVAGGTVEALTDEEAEAAVRSSDSDGDGYLSLEDLETIMAAKGVTEAEQMTELREAFAMYEETAGSGRITARSLKRTLSRLGESKSVRDCQVMISRFDLNRDGVISFDEFAAMMR